MRHQNYVTVMAAKLDHRAGHMIMGCDDGKGFDIMIRGPRCRHFGVSRRILRFLVKVDTTIKQLFAMAGEREQCFCRYIGVHA